VHCAEWSVRGCWTEADLAVLNGAAILLAPDQPAETPGIYDVRLELPDAWPDVATALSPHPGGEPHRFRASSYQELVDSPILSGSLRIARRTVRDVPVTLAVAGHAEGWDVEARADEIARIFAAQAVFWNGVPFRSYHVLQMVGEGRGGLEHAQSTLILSPRHAHRQRADHLGWLGLVSHELFHAWNIKRLRPENLGPFNLMQAAATPDLWVAEGLTSYYDDLLLARAGLITEKEQLEALSKQIRTLQDTPGRTVRSLQDAGTDAWIKHYQPDSDSENAAVSYYTKGAVVGFLLDAELRRATEGAATLDEVMRALYARYSGPTGYKSAQVREVVVEIGGEPLGGLLDQWVVGTGELPYDNALALYGLRWSASVAANPGEPVGGWLGITADSGPQARVRAVRRDGPAWNADVLAGDELVAIDGYRVDGPVDAAIARHDPGTTVTLTLARRGRLREARVVLAEPPETKRWTLEIDPGATPEAVANRRRWLYGPSETEPQAPKTTAAGPVGPTATTRTPPDLPAK
jgi:predicted metalloprotease with PDZ domain